MSGGSAAWNFSTHWDTKMKVSVDDRAGIVTSSIRPDNLPIAAHYGMIRDAAAAVYGVNEAETSVRPTGGAPRPITSRPGPITPPSLGGTLPSHRKT